MRIWKWTLQVIGRQSITMPPGAKLLTVQLQGDTPQLWALVNDASESREARIIATYPTGAKIPEGDPGQYLGTYQLNGGTLIFHVFEPRKEQQS